MENTKIDWCDSTWNPVTGCLHGCEYCYARRMIQRFAPSRDEKLLAELDAITEYSNDVCNRMMFLKAPIQVQNPENEKKRMCPYPFGFTPTFHAYRLGEYARKTKSRNIFVCSMADLFGEWVPEPWIKMVFEDCKAAPQHNYLFLTKNPKRYVWLQYNGKLIKKDNMWYGASVTDRKSWKKVVDAFGDIKCSYKLFLSIEPILENVALADKWNECAAINYMNWVIVGAETGRRKNKVIPRREWIEQIVEDCRRYNTPLFMKSSLADIWGEPLIQEFPEELQKGGGNEICS